MTDPNPSKSLKLQRDLAVALSVAMDADVGYRATLDAAMSLPEVDAAGIYELDQTARRLILVAHSGVSDDFVRVTSEYVNDAPQMDVVVRGQPSYVVYEQLLSGSNNKSAQSYEGISALAVIPIVHRGRVLGSLNVASRACERFPLSIQRDLETLATILGGFVLRIQAEAQRVREQENFRTLFDAVDDLIFILDLEGRILFTNRAVVERLGYVDDELVGRPILKVHREADRDAAVRIVAEMSAGEQVSCALPLETKYGALIPVETRVTLGRWRGREVLLGVSRDISSRIEAEQALAASERRFRSLFANAPLGIYRTTPEGEIVEANAAIATMLGYADPEALKAEVHLGETRDRATPDWRTAFKSQIEAAGWVRGLESTWQRKDGSLICVREYAEVVLDPETNEPRYYEGTVEDITARKRAEATLHFRTNLMNLLAAASTRFINLPLDDLDRSIEDVLSSLGEYTEADRSYIFLFDASAETMSNTHEWCAPGVEAQKEMLTGLPSATFPWWVDRIQNNQEIIFSDIGNLPPEATAEREILEAQDIRSLIVVPLWRGHRALGFLGLDAVQKQELWSEDHRRLLRMVGDMFTNSLLRRQMEAALKESQERLQFAIDGANLGIWDWNLTNDTVVYTERWASMLGYDLYELDPSLDAWTKLLHPEDEPVVYQRLNDHLTGQEAYYSSEHRLRAKDGTWRWVLDRGQVMERDANGVPTRMAGTHMDITDRKRAESELSRYRQRLEDLVRQRTAELRTSEERYRAVVEQAQEGILLLDRHGRVVEWNRRLEAITGLARAEVFDRPLWENPELVRALSVKDAAALATGVQQLISGNGYTPGDTALPSSAGQGATRTWRVEYASPEHHTQEVAAPRMLSLQSFPVRLTQDQLLGVLVADVTSETQALEAAQESQRRYTALFEHANDAVFILDLEGQPIAVNQRAHDLLGYEAGELLGLGFQDLVVPQEQDYARRRIADLLEKRSLPLYQRRFLAKDGTVIPAEINVSVVANKVGEPAQIQSIVRDLRPRLMIDAQMRLQATALAAVSDGVIITNVDGVIEWVNSAFAELTGYTGEEVVGATTNLLKSGQHDAAFYKELWETILSGREWRSEMVNRRKDGTLYSELNSITPMLGPNGEILHFISVKRDITETKELQRQVLAEREQLAERVAERTADLNRANAELARALRAKDEFLASMSHELRTPLSAILGYSEVLKMQHRGALNENQMRFVDSIEKSGQHLLNLINDILDLSKIEAGKLDLTFETVRVAEVAQTSLMFVKQMARKKRIQVHLDIADHVDAVRADRRRLKQALVNLLSNAVKFTPEGGKVGLDVRADIEPPQLVFTVWDTGIGIAESDLGKLFKPFEQIDSRLSRCYAGTGLGLAMVARLADLHGGGVRVESELGAGSRFSLMLPWSPPRSRSQNTPRTETPSVDAVPAGTADADEDAASATIVRGKPDFTILLAEDNKVNVDLIREFLTDAGYEVQVAWDGRQAIHLAEEIKPDLMIIDIQMPEIDGLMVMRLLREDVAFNDTPIIAVTALAMSGDRERCLSAGANVYLSKPVSMSELLQTVEAYLL
jgi:PAS domain S-box-containing protein